MSSESRKLQFPQEWPKHKEWYKEILEVEFSQETFEIISDRPITQILVRSKKGFSITQEVINEHHGDEYEFSGYLFVPAPTRGKIYTGEELRKFADLSDSLSCRREYLKEKGYDKVDITHRPFNDETEYLIHYRNIYTGSSPDKALKIFRDFSESCKLTVPVAQSVRAHGC